ncbi:MAG: four helix bundle protein [Myxococcales bacterium]|nr:four helix bundle protein [Myxococcales bacterium]
MARDPNKLKVFELADQLMINVYRATQRFPVAERFGIQSQLRRAALSIPTNVVEGCARQTSREYPRFLSIALGSASETRYLLDVSQRWACWKTAP